jgi:hypothetical protein
MNVDKKIKQDKISIDLYTTSRDVLNSEDCVATGPICKTKIKVVMNPVPADKYFNALEELCSQRTIAAASGKATTE